MEKQLMQHLYRGYAIESYQLDSSSVGGISVCWWTAAEGRRFIRWGTASPALIKHSTRAREMLAYAQSLLRVDRCLIHPQIVEVTIKLALTESQVAALRRSSGGIFVAVFDNRNGNMRIFGSSTKDPETGNSRGHDGMQEIGLNGLKPFETFTIADYAARELTRQGYGRRIVLASLNIT